MGNLFDLLILQMEGKEQAVVMLPTSWKSGARALASGTPLLSSFLSYHHRLSYLWPCLSPIKHPGSHISIREEFEV